MRLSSVVLHAAFSYYKLSPVSFSSFLLRVLHGMHALLLLYSSSEDCFLFALIDKDEERLYKEDLAAESDDSDDEEKGQEDDSVRIRRDCEKKYVRAAGSTPVFPKG